MVHPTRRPTRARSPACSAIHVTALALLVLAAALLHGCGRPEPASPPVAGPAERLPELPPLSPRDKAAFALERLTQGPLPRTTAFKIPLLQPLNLELARRDLVTLVDETVVLLDDEALQRRSMRRFPTGEGRNAWHAVLDVLAALPVHPVDLALAWTEGVEDTTDAPLRRRAVVVLAATNDVRVAERLLVLLDGRAIDREVGRTATAALIALGSPWRERALEVVFREGGERTWSRIPLLLLGSAAGDGTQVADALAWWSLLTETGAPVPVAETTRWLRPPWAGLILRLRHDVWPADPETLALAVRYDRMLAPELVLEGSGILPQRRDATALVVPRALRQGGRETAALTRAALAEAGFETYLASLRHDGAASDPLLADIARASAAWGTPVDGLEQHRILVETYVSEIEAGRQPNPEGVGPSLHTLGTNLPEAAAALAWTILEKARPYSAHEMPLKVAYEALASSAGERLRATVSALARSHEPGEAAVGLALIRWVRDPWYVDAVTAGLAQVPGEARTMHRRLLAWLYSAPDPTLTDADRAAFVSRYVGWIEELSDAEAGALVTGLLDLGAPGADAYAEGLRGDGRPIYLVGLLSRPGAVPLAVAAALLEALDADTPILERRAALIGAYRSAPAAAAPYLAAARERLAPRDRAEVDDILETIRHRAE